MRSFLLQKTLEYVLPLLNFIKCAISRYYTHILVYIKIKLLFSKTTYQMNVYFFYFIRLHQITKGISFPLSNFLYRKGEEYMEILGLDPRALATLGALEYTNRRNKLIEDSENNIYECKEIKEILQSLPKEKQIEVLENQAYFEAVAKMIEQNNLILLEQMKALQLIQK